MQFHPILNRSERLTHERLSKVAKARGARVFAKVRMADLLPIENSGITASQYKFALQSHLDFIVANDNDIPLFAVEFDGPRHSDEIQLRRDRVKNDLCLRFELPLLRINANYLNRRFRQLDLLSWFAECWFLSKAFDEAQASGAIPYDESFDPAWIMRLPGYDNKFPLNLCTRETNNIRALSDSGKIWDFSPSTYVGVDEQENYYCYAFIRLSQSAAVVVTTGMRNQQFPIAPTEVLEQVAVCDLYSELRQILSGKRQPMPINDLDRLTHSFRSRYEMRCASSCDKIGDFSQRIA